jgi:peptide-methionine (S)-S-oxide reductase
VVKTEVGYSGGTTINPTYAQVCSNQTGHAEVVKVTFDPNLISYDQLLAAFWRSHNPTTLNRQGPDEGSQYRSVIFYHSDHQREKALESKALFEATKNYEGRIVTEIVPAADFYRAEEYHQRYFEKHPH